MWRYDVFDGHGRTHEYWYFTEELSAGGKLALYCEAEAAYGLGTHCMWWVPAVDSARIGHRLTSDEQDVPEEIKSHPVRKIILI